MKKPSNVLKLPSLVLALPFLLNSCASMESLIQRTDWFNPSLKNLPAYQTRQIKQMYITQCDREAEIKTKQMYRMRYCNSAGYCYEPSDSFSRGGIVAKYVTDYQNFFKECMVRNGFFEVKVDPKCYETCRNNGGSSDDCSEKCIITDNN
jgi:hypothetical protein